MNDKPLSQSEYDRLKQSALRNEPVTRPIRLSQIGVTADGLQQNVVTVDGKALSVSDGFIGDMCKALSISRGMASDLREMRNGDDMFVKMVDAMKQIKRHNEETMFMVGDPSSGEVTGLRKDPLARIPNGEMFRITEAMLNKYPSLGVSQIDVGGGGMNLGINIVNSTDIGFGNFGGTDENFKFGLNFSNDNGGTSLSDFFFRLVCLNGAIAQVRESTFRLKQVDAKSIGEMMTYIGDAEKRNFVPRSFEERMKAAIGTPSSFRETSEVVDGLVSMMRVEPDETKAELRERLIRGFFRAHTEVEQKLLRAGVDESSLSKKQASFIRTGMTMWDVVNTVTWLGSHDSEFKWKNGQGMVRMYGGKLLFHEPDLANIALLNL